MEDLPLGRIAALVSEFAVKDLPLGRTMMMMMILYICIYIYILRKATVSYRTYSIPRKTAVLVSECTLEDLPSTELQSMFLFLSSAL